MRTRLNLAFQQMRDRVQSLVAQVHDDCEGLTVHDVTHLDALWETADLIIGPDYPVNPIEAFVFGAAVLIHDAGLAIAAYDDRLDGIKRTKDWRDAVGTGLRRAGLKITEQALADPPSDVRRDAIFHVLRMAHAKQAESLMQMEWRAGGAAFRLLEDIDLRQFYGARIGKIAHSHHWDIGKVQSEFSGIVAPMAGLDPNWTLNEIKVACMLRCADAAHIDQRRAPRMLYAIKNPTGVSEDHWRFQSKMSQAARSGDALIYSSSEFSAEEAPAWWLCFDVARMIDKELTNSSAILAEKGIPGFQLTRVQGVQSPRLFARDVRVAGWEPIEAEVQVSDPVRLALTLGGRNLYGEGFFAPIREILQNAVDAVHARRGSRTAQAFPGLIQVTIKRHIVGGEAETWIRFEDNGLGMSEMIMTGTLIDFGKSIWNSSALLEEYPAIETAHARPVGKFGIGFFSIFLLGRDVRVISKKYDSGRDAFRVLEFSSLTRRPILRLANDDEKLDDLSTSISVKLDDKSIATMRRDGPVRVVRENYWEIVQDDIFNTLKYLCACLDINVSIIDEVNDRRHEHSYRWSDVAADDFIDELFALSSDRERSRIKRAYGHLLRPLIDDEGVVCGRAALLLEEARNTSRRGFLTIGGVSYFGGNPGDYDPRMRQMGRRRLAPSFVGAMRGATDDAARRGAFLDVPEDLIARWTAEQVGLIDTSRHEALTLIPIAHMLVARRVDPDKLPICFGGGRLVTAADIEKILNNADRAYILLSKNYKEAPEWTTIRAIDSELFVNPLKASVFAAALEQKDLLSEEFGRDLLKRIPAAITMDDLSGPIPIACLNIIQKAERVWGKPLKFLVGYEQIMEGDFYVSPNRRLVLTIEPMDGGLPSMSRN